MAGEVSPEQSRCLSLMQGFMEHFLCAQHRLATETRKGAALGSLEVKLLPGGGVGWLQFKKLTCFSSSSFLRSTPEVGALVSVRAGVGRISWGTESGSSRRC